MTPSPEGADNKDSLGRLEDQARQGQTRPDKTGRGCKALGNGIAVGSLALPARDPLVQARNRGQDQHCSGA